MKYSAEQQPPEINMERGCGSYRHRSRIDTASERGPACWYTYVHNAEAPSTGPHSPLGANRRSAVIACHLRWNSLCGTTVSRRAPEAKQSKARLSGTAATAESESLRRKIGSCDSLFTLRCQERGGGDGTVRTHELFWLWAEEG